ncbi:hypothetical protein EON81_29745 [bacterium]|nr:MAG: hypothetical protein EON81_29745 [bacterium]
MGFSAFFDRLHARRFGGPIILLGFGAICVATTLLGFVSLDYGIKQYRVCFDYDPQKGSFGIANLSLQNGCFIFHGQWGTHRLTYEYEDGVPHEIEFYPRYGDDGSESIRIHRRSVEAFAAVRFKVIK